MPKIKASIASAILLLGLVSTDAKKDAAIAAPSCDSACLDKMMDAYLAALVARSPKSLPPLAPNVRITENTNELAIGDGLWGTITGLNSFKLYAEDPQTGQVVSYNIGFENGIPILLGTRLKEVDNKITEVETLVVRSVSGSSGPNTQWTKQTEADAWWAKSLAPSERLPRKQMVHQVNLYFDGIEKGDGNIVPFNDDTTRVENGGLTAPSPARGDRPAMTARDQFNSRAFMYIHQVDHRRFMLVDEEHGIVIASCTFEHPGNIPSGGINYGDPNLGPEPDATPTPAAAASAADAQAAAAASPGSQGPGAQRRRGGFASYPNTTSFFEAFKVVDGKLAHIQALIITLPYRQKPGW